MINGDREIIPDWRGKTNSQYCLEMAGDDTGDNISELNPLYCEMTAVYWGWKNLSADYIGLCHYRRYFTFEKRKLFKRIIDKNEYFFAILFGNLLKPGCKTAYDSKLSIADRYLFENIVNNSSKKIYKLLSSDRFDAVVPLCQFFACRSVRDLFSLLGQYLIKSLEEIVQEINPDFYPYLEETLNGRKLYPANMFIFKKQIFEEYCDIIFPILQIHMSKVVKDKWCLDVSSEKCYSRISGYLAEIITSSFVLKLHREHKTIRQINTIFLED